MFEQMAKNSLISASVNYADSSQKTEQLSALPHRKTVKATDISVAFVLFYHFLQYISEHGYVSLSSPDSGDVQHIRVAACEVYAAVGVPDEERDK